MADAAAGGGNHKRVRKRRNPQRMVNYRLQKKQELHELKEAIAALQVRHQSLIETKGMLAWSEVAQALREHRKTAESDQVVLLSQVHRQATAVKQIYEWVVAQLSLQQSLGPAQSTWQHVSLPSSPVRRTLGKDWILQQLYFNKQPMFEKYKVPAASDPIVHIDLDFQETGVRFIHQGKFQLECPLDVILRVYRDHFCAINLIDAGHPAYGETQTEVTASTTVTSHQLVTPRCQEHANFIMGHFDDGDDVIVFVAQQILHDELFQVQTFQGRKNYWFETRRVSATETCVRYLIVEDQCQSADGHVVPLTEEARIRGFDHQDAWTEAQFLATFRAYSHELDKRCAKIFEELVVQEFLAMLEERT